ncbi:hypothetical protein JW992_10815 [candidate division KSB1 bacterium]|nr:hypothetical protein [candidate division KSB1 bacterium]
MQKLSCHPQTHWLVNRDHILLIRPDNGKKLIIKYPESALWDYVSRNMEWDRLITLLSVLLKQDEKDTADWIRTTLNDWSQQEWLTPEEPHG